MALTVTHSKVNQIADWTQADLDAQIALGNFPAGTVIADIVLASDWNDGHAFDGMFDQITGAALVDMGNADYTMTDAEAITAIKVILNAGDGTKTLTFPTTSDGLVPGNQKIFTLFGANTFYIASESGGSSILLDAPVVDDIMYIAGSTPASLYTNFINNDAYGAGWNGSLLAPTQNSVYDAISSITQSNSVTVSCDFGASFTDKAQTVVTGQTWVTANSEIVAQVKTGSGVDPDEMYLLNLRAVVSDLVAGDGFTLTLYSEQEAKGTYSVMCIGV